MVVHGHGSDESKIMVMPDPNMPNMWHVHGLVFAMPGASGDWQLIIEAQVDGVDDKAVLMVMEEVN